MKISSLFLDVPNDAKFDTFIEDCLPFIRKCMSVDWPASDGVFFFHGSKAGWNDFTKHAFKKRSAPSDTPKDVHDYVNDFMQQHYQVQPRNWMFVGTTFKQALQYGDKAPGSVYCLFPAGNFEWAMFKGVNDFYDDYSQLEASAITHIDDEDDFDYDNLALSIAQEMMHDLHKSKSIVVNNRFDEIFSPGEKMIMGSNFYVVRAINLPKILASMDYKGKNKAEYEWLVKQAKLLPRH